MPRPESFTEDRPVVTMVYHASFGCPEPCAFCCSPEVTDRRWKAMPADRMLDDLGELSERWDFDVVRFYDANWGVNERRVKEFTQGKIDRGLDFHYLALMEPFSILRYKPETLDKLAESGCYVVNLGAEAGSNEMMEKIGKHTVDDDNLNTALELDKRGIDAWMTYIIGYPGEDRKSMYATIDQARRIRAACPRAHPWVWIYQPIPGTPMYRQAIEEGYVPPKSLIEWGNFGEYHVSETWPNRIPQDVLEYRQLYQHFLTLSEGLTRNKIGWWERRAQRRLQTGDWRLGARVEAKAYDIYHKLTQQRTA